MTRLSLILIGLTLLAGPALAGVAEGIAAAEKREFAAARQAFEAAAAENDPQAFYHLGVLYHEGLGVEKDLAKAFKHYHRAANAGLPEAEFALGVFYHRGYADVQKDTTKAVSLYESAAHKGSIAARYNLGMMYSTGEAVPLAYGANPDFVQAFKWFDIVNRSMETPADKARIKEVLAELESHMTPGQLERARAAAEEWWRKHGGK